MDEKCKHRPARRCMNPARCKCECLFCMLLSSYECVSWHVNRRKAAAKADG